MNDEAEINRILSMPEHELLAELEKEGKTVEDVDAEIKQCINRAIAEVRRRRIADPRLYIAIRLWHQFAPEGHTDWDEERHKEEYLRAVDNIKTEDLLNLLLRRLNYDGPDENSLTIGEIRRALP